MKFQEVLYRGLVTAASPRSTSTTKRTRRRTTTRLRRSAKHRNLNRLLPARAFRTNNLLLLRHHQFFVARPTILALIFVYRHTVFSEIIALLQLPLNQARRTHNREWRKLYLCLFRLERSRRSARTRKMRCASSSPIWHTTPARLWGGSAVPRTAQPRNQRIRRSLLQAPSFGIFGATVVLG